MRTRAMNTMKILVLALVWIATGCGNPEDPGQEKQPVIGDPYQSECLGQADGEDDTTVDVLVAGDAITVTDHHAEFNCCLEAWMEVGIEGSEITVVEVEDPDDSNACDCVCPYELSIQISNLEDGDYTVRVYRFAADPDLLIHEETVTIPGSAVECEAPADCLTHSWLVDCLGHWECAGGSCQEVCDMETCGDGTCDAAGGESLESCPDDCAVQPDPTLASFEAACLSCGADECYEPGAPHGESEFGFELEPDPDNDGLFRIRASHQVKCIDVGILGAELFVEGGDLVLVEEFDYDNPVDCYCTQDAAILIAGVAPGTYTLKIYDNDRERLLVEETVAVSR